MKAHKFLENQGIDFELVEQDNPTKSCDDAAQERGVETSQIVKSLILERHREKGDKENSELLHILLPGDREVSEKKLGEHHLVPPKESKKLSGFESGTVHPFSTEIKHIVDYRLMEKDKLSFTIGEKKRGVIIDTSDFTEGLELADFKYHVEDISLTDERDIQRLTEEGLNTEDARFIADRGLTQIYLNLDHSDEELLKTFHELLRHDINIEEKTVSQLIKASENLNHLQKLVENFAETGEISEASEYDLNNVLEEIFESHPEALEDLENGKDSVTNFIIGKVMQKTSGQAKPTKVKEVLKNEY